MLEHQIDEIVKILKNEDIQHYAGESFYNIIKAVALGDVSSGVDAAKAVTELLFHTPTVLFWDKMKRCLYGTFRCYEDQIKFAQRFDKDNKGYYHFVKKLVALVDSIVEDEKIDYLAKLTRCFLLCGIDSAIYFKLVQLIKNCTVDELAYIDKLDASDKLDNNLRVSVLSLQGLFVQEQDKAGNTAYVLSDIGKCLKECSLNYADGFVLYKKYETLKALPQMEPMTWSELDETLNLFGDQLIKVEA